MKSCHCLCILSFLVLLAFSPSTALAQEPPGEADVRPSQVLADAQNVRLLGETGGYLGAIYVVGNRAYVGEGYRLTILDWSNPAQPAVLGRSPLLPGYIYDLVIVDELA